MHSIKFSKSKKIKFYVVCFLLCFMFTFIVVEVGLRFATFSSGTGSSRASERWFKKYWLPINADGFRDFDVSINKNQQSIIFLGDSFTAGHGVKFQETFYFFARENLASQFNLVNLGEAGSSTKKQEVILKLFLSKYDARPQYVVHQYFGNDIEDYTESIVVERSFLRRGFAFASEAFNFVDAYFFISEFTSKYFSQLLEAYLDKEIFEKHSSDIKSIHNLVYKKNGNVIFIVFPFLNSEELIKISGSTYIERLKEFFHHSCKKGDVFIDISPLASSFDTKERVVNFMDAHPSPSLHRMVGELVVKVLREDVSEVSSKYLILCRQ